MKWCSIERIAREVQIPQGYYLAQMVPAEIDDFISALKIWYPDIAVGGESRFLSRSFYENDIFCSPTKNERRFFAILYRQVDTNDLAGCLFLEKNDLALTITSPMAAVATSHRQTGTGLSFLGPILLAAIGKIIGCELAFYISTIRSKGNQILAEKTGYRLVGIIPGNDRDQISPGVVKRVFEVVYAQPLIPMSELKTPEKRTLTETTLSLWEKLFPEIHLK